MVKFKKKLYGSKSEHISNNLNEKNNKFILYLENKMPLHNHVNA